MKQLYFCVSDVTMLICISLPILPNIDTLCTMIDRERFSVFRVGHRVQTSGHLCFTVFKISVHIS
jgi:hypothetical protein